MSSFKPIRPAQVQVLHERRKSDRRKTVVINPLPKTFLLPAVTHLPKVGTNLDEWA